VIVAVMIWIVGAGAVSVGASLVVAASSRRRKASEALLVASATEPEAIEATGSLAVQEQGGEPDTGRGAVRMSARGVMWQIPGAWKAGGGSAPWRHIDSVARRGVTLHVVWGSSSGRTTLQYRGQGAPRLEGIARRHLTSPEWRAGVAGQPGGRWDAWWSRRN
jgi:hypothetical protein